MPYLSHEWLSELVFYGGYRIGGFRGVFVVYTAAICLLMVGVFRLCTRQNNDPLVAAIATFGGGLLAMVGFGPRMHVMGWLCFVAVFAILHVFRYTRTPAYLWLMPLLFCIWINCHASWIVGLFVFFLFFVSGLIRNDIGPLVASPWSKPELRTLGVSFALSCVAVLVNPFGYRLVLYPFDAMFHQPLNIAWVQEWSSVNFNDERGGFVLVALGAIFLAALMRHRRWRIDDAVLTAFVTYCGLHHIRLLMLTGIVLPVLLVDKAGAISSYDPGQERRALNAVLGSVAAIVIIASFPTTTYLTEQINRDFPSGAVHYLRRHADGGRLFNAIEWGGYFEWTLPQMKWFIDPRMDIFEHKGTLKDYMNIATLHQSDELLDRYAISYVIYPRDAPLTNALELNAKWTQVYADATTVILKRAVALPVRSSEPGVAIGP
jgi:hypothetical protein